MDTVRVLYHHEDAGWWAESEDVPGWTVVADNYDALRALARRSLAEFCGADVALAELGAPVAFGASSAVQLSGTTRVSVLGSVISADVAVNAVPPGPGWSTVDAAKVTSDDPHLATA